MTLTCTDEVPEGRQRYGQRDAGATDTGARRIVVVRYVDGGGTARMCRSVAESMRDQGAVEILHETAAIARPMETR
ncbi:MAG: hypothetical protein GY851_09905 [bacterium]|nr:hypothetical protein [bacterium]